jgi:hypothetical protein
VERRNGTSPRSTARFRVADRLKLPWTAKADYHEPELGVPAAGVLDRRPIALTDTLKGHM